MVDSPIIAVNLALLIPATLQQMLVTLNRTLRAPPEGFRFDTTHLPHLTLAQLFIPRSEIERVGGEIGSVLSGLPPLELVTGQILQGRVSTTLRVIPTPELTALHRRLMVCLAPFDTGRGDADAFASDGEMPRAADRAWISMFRQESAFAFFAPHITLGVGRVENLGKPSRFVARDVALCQLGRFCTCRYVLDSWTLIVPRQ